MSLFGEQQLADVATRVRRRCIDLSTRGSCFLGSALSVADLLVAVYGGRFRFDPQVPNSPERDRLVLSKGHAVPALYAILEELGVLAMEEIDRHARCGSLVYWHPNDDLPGIDACTGSLGQGFGVACGLALANQLDGRDLRTVCIVGDGECQEGMVWETALFCAKRCLDNLLVLVDRNGIQANLATEELLPLEPFAAKWRSFGWHVQEVGGHDLDGLQSSIEVGFAAAGPAVIIANTVRGKGVPSIEGRPDKWIVKADVAYASELTAELEVASK